ncbi:MAG: thiamine pyrophosphate-binding protein [Hyphomicrobiales bacterium]
MSLRHGGQILVDQLSIQGVERVFCIPGESFLAALDGLYESSIETIVCRQEGGVAMMADATARLTGKPGVAFVTRGPGATNASAGVHIAFQDSIPMVLFIGQVASDQKDREAFQEVDYRQMFGPLAKWVAEIETTDRIPEYVSHAFHVANSGRPGPVVLALPEDMLSAMADVPDAPVATPTINSLSTNAAQQICETLESAERPLVIVGGGGWTAQAAQDLGVFAAKLGVPVATSFRCQDYIDNTHLNYVGDVGIGINPTLSTYIKNSDCLVVIGSRLGEMTTSGYTLLEIPKPQQKLIHIYPDASELGRVYRPDLAFVAGSAEAMAQLANASSDNRKPALDVTQTLAESYRAWQEPEETPGDLKLEQVMSHLRDVLPADTIISNGAGNYAGWLHRYYRFRQYRTQLAPTSGSMGFGLPASVAAKLQYPDRTVICYAGDGDFQMHCQEFGTACQYGANIIVLISNNGLYGTIRMHQEKHYPGRVSGTGMVNPDFAKWAESYGGYGETVTTNADFPAALKRAQNAGKPAILNLMIDPHAIATRMVLKEA